MRRIRFVLRAEVVPLMLLMHSDVGYDALEMKEDSLLHEQRHRDGIEQKDERLPNRFGRFSQRETHEAKPFERKVGRGGGDDKPHVE